MSRPKMRRASRSIENVVTAEMLQAGVAALRDLRDWRGDEFIADQIYRAMLAAKHDRAAKPPAGNRKRADVGKTLVRSGRGNTSSKA